MRFLKGTAHLRPRTLSRLPVPGTPAPGPGRSFCRLFSAPLPQSCRLTITWPLPLSLLLEVFEDGTLNQVHASMLTGLTARALGPLSGGCTGRLADASVHQTFTHIGASAHAVPSTCNMQLTPMASSPASGLPHVPEKQRILPHVSPVPCLIPLPPEFTSPGKQHTLLVLSLSASPMEMPAPGGQGILTPAPCPSPTPRACSVYPRCKVCAVAAACRSLV